LGAGFLFTADKRVRNRTDHDFPSSINRLQLVIGLTVLALGTLVYFLCRAPQQVYFISALGIPAKWLAALPKLTCPAQSNLPAFVHVFAFILISASLAARRKGGYALAAAFWLVLETAIELGQKYKTTTVALIPEWLRQVPVLGHAKHYFWHGTFDPADLAATALGAAAAFAVLCLTAGKTRTGEES
jgi:hypothetical protein